MKRTPQELLAEDDLQRLRQWVEEFSAGVARGLDWREDIHADSDKSFFDALQALEGKMHVGPASTTRPPQAYRPIKRPAEKGFQLDEESREVWRRLRSTDDLNRWLALGAIVDSLLTEEHALRTFPKAVPAAQENSKIPDYVRPTLAKLIRDTQAKHKCGMEKAAARVLDEMRDFPYEVGGVQKIGFKDTNPASLIRMLQRQGLLGGDKN